MFAPVPYLEEFTEHECAFAGIPADPRMQALLIDRPTSTSDHFDKMEKLLPSIIDPDFDLNEKLSELKRERQEAELYHAEVAEWMPYLDDYLDQFKSELCLDLRRGELSATCRKLTHPNLEDSLAALEGDKWFDEIEVSNTPAIAWLASDINWEGSAIFGRSAAYIWIQIDVAQMLNRYPPSNVAKPEQLIPMGETFVLSSFAPSPQSLSSKRGRPALPWEPFHVEVARLYQSGEMPKKKEAAIALLQEWFHRHGKTASRSAIGQKLKPYFDQLGRK